MDYSKNWIVFYTLTGFCILFSCLLLFLTVSELILLRKLSINGKYVQGSYMIIHPDNYLEPQYYVTYNIDSMDYTIEPKFANRNFNHGDTVLVKYLVSDPSIAKAYFGWEKYVIVYCVIGFLIFLFLTKLCLIKKNYLLNLSGWEHWGTGG